MGSNENKKGFEIDTKDGDRNDSVVVKIEEDDYANESFERRSNYFGVILYNYNREKWRARRWSKNKKKSVSNGTYKDEETAAHASDSLARKLIANGEKDHKLNFPENHNEVRPEKRNNFIGVSYNQKYAKWQVGRWSKNEKRIVRNGTYNKEKTAAHASDTLAREFIANGEEGHKLNFPNDNHTDVRRREETYQKMKRKRPNNLTNSQNSESYENSI